MKKAIVFCSNSGNTKKLAETIYSTVGEEIYCGKPTDEALDAEMLFIGSWTQAFACVEDMKKFAQKLNNKKVFLFMACGYNHTEEYYAPIINSFKEHINDSNEIVGQFICQAKVSASKMEAIKQLDMAKYETYLPELERSQTHPDENDLESLIALIQWLKL